MEKMICPRCGSSRVIKNGTYLNKKNNIRMQRYYCKDCISSSEEEKEIIKTCEKLAKRNQYLVDEKRISNKTWRHNTRISNMLESLSSEIKETFTKYDYNICSFKENNQKDKMDEKIGIIQLSDLHFGELINIEGNEYDFQIASRRLYKLISKSIDYFLLNNIRKVVLCMTGDLFNSNRRLEEIMSQSANRSNSLFIGTKIIENIIIHLGLYFEKIIIAAVSGNESRIEKDWGWTDSCVSDNFDFILFNILKYKFANDKNIQFIKGNPTELVLEINGNNFLLIHGNQIGNNTTQEVQKIIGKYSTKNIRIDYVIFGHLHQSYISDIFSRSSSLCGANAYSDRGLNLSSRASQNIFIVGKNKNIDSIKVDLQEYDESGYNISDEMIVYETKSIDKLNSQNEQIIMKIVI